MTESGYLWLLIGGLLAVIVTLALRLFQLRKKYAVLSNNPLLQDFPPSRVQHLIQAVTSIQAGIVVTDTQGVIEYVNPAFSTVTGYAAEEVVGKRVSVISSGEHPQSFYQDMWETISSGQVWQGELCNRHKDGRLLWEEEIISPIFDVAGRITHFVSVWLDQTASRSAFAALAKNERVMRTAIDAIDEAFVLYDPEDKLVYFNEKYAEIYHSSADLIAIGNSFEDIIRTGAERGQYAAAKGRVDEWVAERMAIHRSGKTEMVQHLDSGRWVRIIERKTSDGYIVGFRVDVTELMLAREAAEASSRAKTEFLANMSHEIRTPMNAIMGLSHLCLMTPMTDVQKNYLRKINEASTLLLGVMNDVLDFSKIEAGKMVIEQIEFDLEDVLSKVMGLFGDRAKEKGLQCEMKLAENLPYVLLGDSVKLSQVLTNLLSNAIKFTEVGGVSLEVACVEQADGLCRLGFRVTDSGIGITEADQKKLFNPFVQADASTTRKYGGTGLGLKISKKIVELMGGEISMRSQLGEGTSFYFEIPLCELAAESEEMPFVVTAESMNIALLLDPDRVERSVMARQLGGLGYAVFPVASAEEMLRVVETSPAGSISLVVMELALPDVDRLQAIRQIRLRSGYEKLPVILLCRAEYAALQELDLRGIQRVLNKPVSRSALTSAVERIRDRDRLHAKTESAPSKPLPHTAHHGKRVLLVEDNEVNQIVANGLLKMMGFEIVLAENGAIALELIGQQHFDLVMMDIQMPVMDGISATREIRSRWPDLQLPIIALTAHAFDEEVERCRAVGMDAVLTKPIEPPKLHSLLDDFLGEAGVAAKATTELAVTPALESVAEPVSVEAAPAATLPSVVLDRSIGLYYAGDDTAIYQHALVSFKAKVSGLPEALEALLAAGRTDEARRMVHTVRGVAGAVGAMRLQKIVADLEGQIYAGRLAELDDLLGLLQRELVVVLGEVDSELAP